MLRPGSCRRGHVRVTTSWSIPNSPPDGPQVELPAGRLLFTTVSFEFANKSTATHRRDSYTRHPLVQIATKSLKILIAAFSSSVAY
jgi:hypothetical protein